MSYGTEIPRFLKSEIGPFSDLKEKFYLMGLKSTHFQEPDFQELGEGDRFFKMAPIFQTDRALLRMVFVWYG